MISRKQGRGQVRRTYSSDRHISPQVTKDNKIPLISSFTLKTRIKTLRTMEPALGPSRPLAKLPARLSSYLRLAIPPSPLDGIPRIPWLWQSNGILRCSLKKRTQMVSRICLPTWNLPYPALARRMFTTRASNLDPLLHHRLLPLFCRHHRH